MRAEIVGLTLGVVLCQLRVTLHGVGDDSSPGSIERTLSTGIANMMMFSVTIRSDSFSHDASQQGERSIIVKRAIAYCR